MTNVFTYGSLMCRDIMDRVAACRPNSVAAVLPGFRRTRLRGEEYPAIVAQPQSEVAGILYLHLPPMAIQRLDTFEGEQYVRREVRVLTEAFGPCVAMAYVLHPGFTTLLTDEPWSYADFLATGKDKFLAAYLGFDKIL